MAPSLNLATLILLPMLLSAVIPQTLARNVLYSGQSLYQSQQLTMGNYVFAMQGDCNLVLYASNRAIWASGTNGKGNGCRCTMQSDGNLVVYTNANRAVWASNTNIGSNSYQLVVQGDRNVVIYIVGGRAIWATGTNVAGTPDAIIEKFVPMNATTTKSTNVVGEEGGKN